MAKKSYIETVVSRTRDEVETELNKIYADAYNEALDAVEKRSKSFNRIYEEQLKAYKEEGAYTPAQWRQWVNTQERRNASLQKDVEIMAERMARTNEIAADYINGVTPTLFALSANYEAFLYELDYLGRVSFKLINEDTLASLARGENHTEFDAMWKHVETARKPDYKWNYERIQSQLHQGLLKGESTGKIAQRFLNVMESNEHAAIRNARTAITSAQNAGCMATFERAAKMGIKVQKKWLATLDSRTRDSHRDMDGETVDWDDRFSNGLLMPGDASGDPAEVYNCRCSMERARAGNEPYHRAYKVVGEGGREHRAYDENGKPLYFDGTYREWEKWKKENGYG